MRRRSEDEALLLTRARVRCGLNLRPSLGNPIPSVTASMRSHSSSRVDVSPPTPTHSTLAGPDPGKTPKSASRSDIAGASAAISPTSEATVSATSVLTSPRNFSVRWTPSGRTRRSPPRPISSSCRQRPASTAFTSSGTSMARKARSVSAIGPSPTSVILANADSISGGVGPIATPDQPPRRRCVSGYDTSEPSRISGASL